MLNYLRYYTGDLANGEGIRCTLFVTGCSHGCKGCYNPSTWNPANGSPVDEEIINRIITDLHEHTGFSLSGGDPLFPPNRDAVTALLRRVKEAHPSKDVWVWTGFKFSEVQHLEVMKYIDVLVDGKYEKTNPTLKPWRGSDNQELIYLCNLSSQ